MCIKVSTRTGFILGILIVGAYKGRRQRRLELCSYAMLKGAYITHVFFYAEKGKKLCIQGKEEQ